MNKSLAYKGGFLLMLMYALAPFYSFVVYKAFGKGIVVLFLLPAVLVFFIQLLEKGNLKIPGYVIFYSFFSLYVILSDAILAKVPINFGYLTKNVYLASVLVIIIIENMDIDGFISNSIRKVNFYVILIAFFVILVQQVISPTFFTNPEKLSKFEVIDDSFRIVSIYSWGLWITYIGLSFYPVFVTVLEDFLEKDKKVFFALVIVGIFVAILNRARHMLVDYFVALLLIPIRMGSKIYDLVRYAIIIVFLGFGIYLTLQVVGFDLQKYVDERLLEKNKGGITQTSAGTRILAFKVFGQLFPLNPVFGKGNLHMVQLKGQKGSHDIRLVRVLHERSSQIHVGYLSLLYYYGLIGGIIYLLFVVTLTRKLWKDARMIGRWGPFLGWMMFLVSNLTLVKLDIFIMGILMILFINRSNIENYKAKIIIS